MSLKKNINPVKLVIGIFTKAPDNFNFLEKLLIKKWGPIDYSSKIFPFNETDYYTNEMGAPLFMKLLSFDKLIKRDHLPKVKKQCWKLEDQFSISQNSQKKRIINIDPGLLSMENFILATGKGYSHRIYLSHGVYADLTLIYQNNGYQSLPWTYLNYQGDQIKKILLEIRKNYQKQLFKKEK